MPDSTAATDAVDSARSAVAADVASVTSAIDDAIADIEQQLATLAARRGELESALAAVNEQSAAIDAQRSALEAARDQLADGKAPREAVPEAEATGEDLEFSEDELDPELPRTQRVATILARAGEPMHVSGITDILNEFGDTTTVKVVGGTLSNLARRGAVRKEAPGVFAAG